MSCAKNIVAVGDLKQLPHIPNEVVSKASEAINTEFSIDERYSYTEESLLSSLTKLFQDMVPAIMLVEHYRCHPRIIDFCNQKFYDGQLITMTKGTAEPFKVIRTVKGNHARKPPSRKGWINIRELDVITKEILEGDLQSVSRGNIGVTSPYRGQVDKAKGCIPDKEVQVDTVYKFQGREKDVVIFSTTANQLTRYVDNPNLLNVAVSRAKQKFILVTSGAILKKQGSNIGDLIRHIEYQSLSESIFESKTISIFDCLYREYSSVLDEFNQKVKGESKFKSENLMRTLLDEVLESARFSSFSFQANYTLNLLISDYSQFSEREYRYAKNSNTHVDFVVFNKLDKLPILAIEVDGYKFHELNEKQRERDKLKNRILKYLGIHLIRFSTVGSGEKEKLISELDKLLTAPPESDDGKLLGLR